MYDVFQHKFYCNYCAAHVKKLIESINFPCTHNIFHSKKQKFIKSLLGLSLHVSISCDLHIPNRKSILQNDIEEQNENTTREQAASQAQSY